MVDIANIRTSRWQEPAPDLIRGRRREARSEVYLLAYICAVWHKYRRGPACGVARQRFTGLRRASKCGEGELKAPLYPIRLPCFPVSRLSSAMGHGNDFKPVGSFSIYQVERKAVERITTRAVNIPRPHFGVSSYTRHRQIKLDKIGRCAAEGLLSRYHR
jgi:hypothetical protein